MLRADRNSGTASSVLKPVSAVRLPPRNTGRGENMSDGGLGVEEKVMQLFSTGDPPALARFWSRIVRILSLILEPELASRGCQLNNI